jgi:hypothetical protein
VNEWTDMNRDRCEQRDRHEQVELDRRENGDRHK